MAAITCSEIMNARREMFKKLDPPGTFVKIKNTKFEDTCISQQLKIPETHGLISNDAWL